ncbi:hypothetical protein GUJ93_ZPchr0005g14630 [Zizania palustris]|uniref:HMA domain-containing protein n=1 Tax=Zizania palustris TaxID=103762 RepID=A0A8J5T468_ZIZPA|nr:hypothetical protein GUJ93_ZPchr0005g14630 [Zizania palustris]
MRVMPSSIGGARFGLALPRTSILAAIHKNRQIVPCYQRQEASAPQIEAKSMEEIYDALAEHLISVLKNIEHLDSKIFTQNFTGISREMQKTSSMASESLQLQCKTLALRVSIHCQGCKKKVKKVLLGVEGVYKCDIDGRSNKATVAVTGKVSADTLVRKLRRAGKHAEQWPEEQKQQWPQEQPSGAQRPEEIKNQAAVPDGGEPAEKPASSDAAEPSDPKASTEERKNTTGEAAAPAEVGTESTNANASGSAAGDDAETGAAQQTGEPKRRRKQQQEEKAGEAIMAVAALTQASHTPHFPAAAPLHQFPQQQPVHVMSYNVARPSASGAYYAAAPTAAPASARPPPPPLPPQEHPFLYSPYYSQPPPYSYSYHHHYNGSHATPPQRSAASPATNSYGDLFSDDNANSCRVM